MQTIAKFDFFTTATSLRLSIYAEFPSRCYVYLNIFSFECIYLSNYFKSLCVSQLQFFFKSTPCKGLLSAPHLSKVGITN